MSYVIKVQLIGAFVFAHAKIGVSQDEAHLTGEINQQLLFP